MSLKAPIDAAQCHLIAYDIADDKRRIEAAKALLKLGVRVQYSLFELWLAPGDVAPVVAALGEIIDARFDRVDVVAVCAGCTERWRRLGATVGPPLPWQVI